MNCIHTQRHQDRRSIRRVIFLSAALIMAISAKAAETPSKYFQITVVDEQTGRGVPLVELKTVNAVRYYTDSNGIVAFGEPGLMNRTVFFHVKSHGYEFPADGFGIRGTRVHVTEGGSVRLKIKRVNIAERLYRVTGAGIYRDSLLAGHAVPTEKPLLNGLVFGQDSVLTTIYHGKIYWFWGDTSRPGYPLGNFHCPGATSLLPEDGGLDPEVGVDLNYFLDGRGFAKETAHLPGDGPTWLDGLVTLPDDSAGQRVFAHYVKVAKPMVIYENGLVEFDDRKKQFVRLMVLPEDTPLLPAGHPLQHVSDGVRYVYFSPLTRVLATPEAYQDLSQYETYSCFKQGSRADSIELDRDAEGRVRYTWKGDTIPLTPKLQARLIKEKRIKPEEGWFHLKDIETGKPVLMQHHSVYFNEYRKRWVLITSESFGTTMLGEIWYAEADTPIGPWVYARKIVTHDNYSFYNPKHHPMFDKQGGRIIFFEGTYTHTFSGNPDQTPRYDYNQIMYKLDLADLRLVLPVPVYDTSEEGIASRFVSGNRNDRPCRVAFYALDRPVEGAIAVHQRADGTGLEVSDSIEPLFYALPAETDYAPPETTPLYEFIHQDGQRRAYSTDASRQMPDYQRTKSPLCLVWRDPTGGKIPALGPFSER